MAKIGDKKEIKLKSGKIVTFIIYHLDPLVVGVQGGNLPTTTWKKQQETVEKWYDDEFSDEFKEIFPKSSLTTLCIENILDPTQDKDLFFVKPISKNNFHFDYFNRAKDGNLDKYFDDNWYWTRNKSSYSSSACFISGGGSGVNYDIWNDPCSVSPVFIIRN